MNMTHFLLNKDIIVALKAFLIHPKSRSSWSLNMLFVIKSITFSWLKHCCRKICSDLHIFSANLSALKSSLRQFVRFPTIALSKIVVFVFQSFLKIFFLKGYHLFVVPGEDTEVQLPHWNVQRDLHGRDGQRDIGPRVSSDSLEYLFKHSFLHSESKLDPEGPAYQKMKNSKKFDPKRSSVLMVLNAQVEHKTYVELGRLLVPSLVEDLVVKAY